MWVASSRWWHSAIGQLRSFAQTPESSRSSVPSNRSGHSGYSDSLPKPFEPIRQFRPAGASVRQLADEQRERLDVSGDPQGTCIHRLESVGSPKYFASHPAPSTPHDLRKHRCINFRLPSAGTLYKWEFEKAHHRVEVGVEGPLISGDVDVVTDAALAGVGLAYLFEEQLASLLQAGALSRVLEDWCPPFPGFFLYYPGRRQVSPALAASIDAFRVPAKTRKSQ